MKGPNSWQFDRQLLVYYYILFTLLLTDRSKVLPNQVTRHTILYLLLSSVENTELFNVFMDLVEDFVAVDVLND